jgi:hypothetical protein
LGAVTSEFMLAPKSNTSRQPKITEATSESRNNPAKATGYSFHSRSPLIHFADAQLNTESIRTTGHLTAAMFITG